MGYFLVGLSAFLAGLTGGILLDPWVRSDVAKLRADFRSLESKISAALAALK